MRHREIYQSARPMLVWAWFALVLFVAYMSLRPLHLDLVVQNGDKVLHLATYAFLALCAPWRFQGRIPLVILGFLVLVGGLLEVGQGILATGRSADIADACANGVGTGLGVLIRCAITWKLVKRRAYGK
jgi:VanZ family protein